MNRYSLKMAIGMMRARSINRNWNVGSAIFSKSDKVHLSSAYLEITEV